jgi:hypothetical protein
VHEFTPEFEKRTMRELAIIAPLRRSLGLAIEKDIFRRGAETHSHLRHGFSKGSGRSALYKWMCPLLFRSCIAEWDKNAKPCAS